MATSMRCRRGGTTYGRIFVTVAVVSKTLPRVEPATAASATSGVLIAADRLVDGGYYILRISTDRADGGGDPYRFDITLEGHRS